MGIKERKEREKEELRQKILDAAAEILISQGIEKCTIRKVASSIEYSPRTVYLYFKDKDHLLREIIEKGFEISVRQMTETRKEFDYSNPRELISFQLRNNVNNALGAPNFYKAVVYLLHFKNYEPGPHQEKLIQGVKLDIRKSYEALKMPVENIDEKTDQLFGFLRGFNLVIVNKKLKPGSPETEKFIELGIKSMIDGILKFP
ncbi:MAG: TetR/AcrR family transcriptional regulator [Bacteroidota bacterium]